MFYYAIVISLLLYFLLKPFGKWLAQYTGPFIKLHYVLATLSAADLLLMLTGWRFAGAYTSFILFTLALCTGIISARFVIDTTARTKSVNYFKSIRVFTIVFVIMGMIPVFTGYGGGFIKNILNVEYISYPTGQGYVYRIVKQGYTTCNSLRLYQQCLFLEDDIPVVSEWDRTQYDCFDPLRFTIVKAGSDTIVAEVKFRGPEIEYFILDKKNKKLNYNRYWDGYTFITHTVNFGYLSYHHTSTKSHLPADTFMNRLRRQQEQYGYDMKRYIQDDMLERPEDSGLLKQLDSAMVTR